MPGYKRFGIDQGNIDLERRLRTIEQEIKTKADANSVSDVSSQSRLTPLQVENVSITGGIQSWRLEWDSVTSPDLAKYVVQVSETATFDTFVNYDIDTPYFEYTIEPGVTDTVNYVRVRAVTNLDFEGPWSAAFDVTSGLLISSDFEQGATTGFVQWSQTSFDNVLSDGLFRGANPYTWPGGGPVSGDEPDNVTNDTYGPVYYTAVDGGVVFPYVSIDCEYQNFFGFNKIASTDYILGDIYCRLTSQLLRRPTGGVDTTINTAEMDFLQTTPISPGWGLFTLHNRWKYVDVTRTRFFFPLLPDTPGQGDWEYRLKLSVEAGALCDIYLKPTTLKIVLFEFRR